MYLQSSEKQHEKNIWLLITILTVCAAQVNGVVGNYFFKVVYTKLIFTVQLMDRMTILTFSLAHIKKIAL